MTSNTSRVRVSIAVGAAFMSGFWGVFVPYGHPWPMIAWAMLACALAVWVGVGSVRQTAQMSDVIRDVEEESPRASPGPGSGVESRGSVS